MSLPAGARGRLAAPSPIGFGRHASGPLETVLSAERLCATYHTTVRVEHIDGRPVVLLDQSVMRGPG